MAASYFPSLAGAAVLGSGVVTAPQGTTIDLYVSGTLGNDGNPGTQASPLATLGRAEELIPDVVTANYRIHLRAETYQLPSNARNCWFRARTFVGALVTVFADEAWDSAVYTNVLTEASVAGTGAAAVVATSVLVANAHRGRSLRMTSGAAVGQIRRINSNTTTTISPSAPFSPAPAPGDTFQIFTAENTIINAPAAVPSELRYLVIDTVLAIAGGISFASNSSLPSVGGVQLQGLLLTATVFGSYIGAGPTYFYGVTGAVRKIGGILYAGAGNPVSALLLIGWGQQVTAGAVSLAGGARFVGYYHGTLECIGVDLDCFADIYGGFIRRSLGSISGICRIGTSGSSTTPFVIESPSHGISIDGPGQLIIANATVSGSLALSAHTGAVINLASSVTSANGVKVDGASKILCAGAPAVGGAGSDWTVQGAAAFNKTALAALNSAVIGTDGSVATRST